MPAREPHLEQQAVGLQNRPDIEPGDQAGEKPTYSTAKGKVTPGLSLNGAPGCGQGVGLSWGCSGPLRPIKAH